MHTVTKQQSQIIADEIKAAVSEILEKHNFSQDTLKYGYGDYFSLRVQATPMVEGDNGVNLNSPEAQSYLLEAKYNDALSEDAIGREFAYNGETFIFEGFVSRRPKYPYSAKRVKDGRSYKFTRDIERFLG